MFLLLKLGGEKSLAFDVDDYEGFLEYFKLGSLDFADTQNGPAVQALVCYKNSRPFYHLSM